MCPAENFPHLHLLRTKFQQQEKNQLINFTSSLDASHDYFLTIKMSVTQEAEYVQRSMLWWLHL